MFNAFAITLRELAELLLIAQALQLCLSRHARPELRKAMLAGLAAGLGAAGLLASWTRGGRLDADVEALVSIAFALIVIALTMGMLSSATLLRRRVERFVEARLDTHGAPLAIAGFAALVAFREGAEILVFVNALADDIGGADALTGLLLGVVGAGCLAVAYRRLQARLPLLVLFGLSTLLMSALAIQLLIEGLGTLMHARLDARSGLLEFAQPFLDGGRWHAWLSACLMLPPVLVLARRWWHGASLTER